MMSAPCECSVIALHRLACVLESPIASRCHSESAQVTERPKRVPSPGKAAAGAAPFTVFIMVPVAVVMDGGPDGHNYGCRCEISDIISAAPLPS